MNFQKLKYYDPVEKVSEPKIIKKDLIVYGATPAGITSAIQAKKMGLNVAIAELVEI